MESQRVWGVEANGDRRDGGAAGQLARLGVAAEHEGGAVHAVKRAGEHLQAQGREEALEDCVQLVGLVALKVLTEGSPSFRACGDEARATAGVGEA